MDHQTLQEHLFAFYDGELTAAEQRAIEDHLPDCAARRARLAQWQRVAGVLIQQASAITPSDAFVERVMGRLTKPHAHRARRFHPLRDLRWLAPTLALAATACALLLIARPASTAVSIETLLLADEPDSPTLQQALIAETPSPEVILGLLMEDAS